LKEEGLKRDFENEKIITERRDLLGKNGEESRIPIHLISSLYYFPLSGLETPSLMGRIDLAGEET